MVIYCLCFSPYFEGKIIHIYILIFSANSHVMYFVSTMIRSFDRVLLISFHSYFKSIFFSLLHVFSVNVLIKLLDDAKPRVY